MKKLVLVSILFLAASALQANPARIHLGVTFDYFYTSLSPHGEWIELDRDVIVWRPFHVRHSWSPYSDGHWIWTTDGWYWDSYEPFGWATYHYGRWFYDDFYGWVWLPEYEWAPAWVEWRYNDNYIGWAPLPPYASFHMDFGIRFSTGWHSRHNYWNFVGYRHFGYRNMNVYIVDHSTNINIYNNTKYRTNYHSRDGRIVNGGVERNFIERRSGYRMAERSINSTDNYSDYKSRRGDDSRSVTAFRPSERQVEKSRGVDRTKITRGSSRSSLEVSKITRSNESRTRVESRSTRAKESKAIQRETKRNESKSRTLKKSNESRNKELKKSRSSKRQGKSESYKKKLSTRKQDGYKKNTKSKSYGKDFKLKQKKSWEVKSKKPKSSKKSPSFKKHKSGKQKSFKKPSKKSNSKSKSSSRKAPSKRKTKRTNK